MLSYSIYKLSEKSKWVTFVHGAGGSSTIWYKQLRVYKRHFNLLTLDLRGHGKSKPITTDSKKTKYTFDLITSDIIEVLNHLNIEKSHFVGISLGTIIIRNLSENYPNRVSSMVFAGAIVKLNFQSQFLLKLGVLFKSIIPYIILYHFFAFIIMPKRNHRRSRLLFVREAKKLNQKEFIRWFALASEVNLLLKNFRKNDIKIPSLYLMGQQDHLFLASARKLSEKHLFSSLIVIPNSGHVVNIDRSFIFNTKSIEFINSKIE